MVARPENGAATVFLAVGPKLNGIWADFASTVGATVCNTSNRMYGPSAGALDAESPKVTKNKNEKHMVKKYVFFVRICTIF